MTDFRKIFGDAIAEAEKSSGLKPMFGASKSFGKSASTFGSLCLDFITGGGIPPGRIVGLVGREGMGKSVITTEAFYRQVEDGNFSVYYDSENGTDENFLIQRGLDFKKFSGKRNKNGDLLPNQIDQYKRYTPMTDTEFANHIYTILKSFPKSSLKTAPPILFGLDSAMSLVPEHLLAMDDDANNMAAIARMYSTLLLQVNAWIVNSGTSLLITNQIRDRPMVQFGSPEYEPGGNALKHFTALRIELSRSKPTTVVSSVHPFIHEKWAKPRADGVWEEDGGTSKYKYTEVYTVKNKVYAPHKSSYFRTNILYKGMPGHGLDHVFDIFQFLSDAHLLVRSGRTKKNEEAKFELVKSPHIPVDLSEVILNKKDPSFTLTEWSEAIYPRRHELFKLLRKNMICNGAVWEHYAEAMGEVNLKEKKVNEVEESDEDSTDDINHDNLIGMPIPPAPPLPA